MIDNDFKKLCLSVGGFVKFWCGRVRKICANVLHIFYKWWEQGEDQLTKGSTYYLLVCLEWQVCWDLYYFEDLNDGRIWKEGSTTKFFIENN
jgi:hypothetical protein